ncbi:MAG TPA: amidohydrolase family protein, partial [Acidobacteriaceae bacterium]|nr:amidohydrolase family protein [Acidobacteriaceae bacterium]
STASPQRLAYDKKASHSSKQWGCGLPEKAWRRPWWSPILAVRKGGIPLQPAQRRKIAMRKAGRPSILTAAMQPSFQSRPTRRSRLTRRQFVAGMLASIPAAALGIARPRGPIVDTHVHLFSPDPQRFPFAPNAPYRPAPLAVEDYVRFALSVGIDHAVLVHAEPYQDDHRYLEYCFAHEPSPYFFKGTCLFDPTAQETPDRLAKLVEANPGRIVALRIHETHPPGTPSLTQGPIKDRDLRSPAMKATWRRVQQLGLAVQMHFLPCYAPQIGELAEQFPDTPVILDHLGRVPQGSSADFASVVKLAKLPRAYMKYSNVTSPALKPTVRRLYDAFGPDRMIWGYFGHDRPSFDQQVELFDTIFDFASEDDREKIRGRNALRLFKWSSA